MDGHEPSIRQGRRSDGGAAVLPDRAISPHPNLVTRRGLRLIEARVAEFERQLAEAATTTPEAQAAPHASCAIGPPGSARARLEGRRRPLPRRRCSAPGHRHARARPDTWCYEIVGEDEAEPEDGRIAWTSPVARALLGGEPGEVRRLPKGEIEIVADRSDEEARRRTPHRREDGLELGRITAVWTEQPASSCAPR